MESAAVPSAVATLCAKVPSPCLKSAMDTIRFGLTYVLVSVLGGQALVVVDL
jgi:hypothetical protein